MSGGSKPAAGSTIAARSTPASQASPPAPQLIAPTGSPGINNVVDVVNATAAPFMSAPPAEQGVAGAVAQGLGGVLGVVGAPTQIIDTAFATLTAPIAAMFPAMPAVTLLGMHVGVPHAHSHPPSLIPPAPPVPLPSIGALVGSGSVTVLIGGMPAARAGDIGISVTCGSLAPPFEVFTGSSNVFIGGARAARVLDITKHCNPTSMGPFAIAMGAAGVAAGAAGALATRNIFAAAQAAADAAVLAIKLLCGKDPGLPPGMGTLVGPPVPNVLIGGFPCPPVGEMAFGAILKKLQGVARAFKKRSPKRNNANSCKGSEPINLVTGENFVHYLDFASGGLLEWRRHYTTARARQSGPLGHGWRHFYQRSLSVRLHRATFTDWDGDTVEFPRFERGRSETRADGHVLRRLARGHYRVSHREEPVLEFAGDEFATDLPLVRVIGTDSELELTYAGNGQLFGITEHYRATGERREYRARYDSEGHIGQLVELNVTSAAGGRPGDVIRAAYGYLQGMAGGYDLVQITDAMGGVWSNEYDAFHRLTRQTDARGYSYTYQYDALGRCREATGQDGLWWAKMEYFPEKNFTRYTEGEGAVWHLHYKDGVVTKIVDPYGGVRIRELDGEDKLIRDVDSGGRAVFWLYDHHGAHHARLDEYGNLYPPELELADLPSPFERTLPNTALEIGFGELFEPSLTAVAGLAPAILTSVPPEFAGQARAVFRVASGAGPDRLWTRLERDLLGRVTREVDSLGRTREWHYDATGNVVGRLDRDGRYSSLETTSWNLLGKSSDPLGNAMEYEYSRTELVVGVKDPLGNVTRYEYDEKERLVRVSRQGRVRDAYVYDAGDHFIEKRDGAGELLFSNEMHENHRVAVRQLASGGQHRFDYHRDGRPTEASTDEHEIKLVYRDSGPAYSDTRDGLGVEHTRRFRDWTTHVLKRFELQRRQLRGWFELEDCVGRRTRLAYDPSGAVRRWCSNGSVEILKYDAEGRLEAQLVHRRDERLRPSSRCVAYTYSAEGDLLRVDDSQQGTTTHEVDLAHRLIGETTPQGQRLQFYQDPVGNVLSHPGLPRLWMGPGNRIRMTTDEQFQFDARDRLWLRVQRGGAAVRYVYDSFDMLRAIEHVQPDGSSRVVWRAAYDALGRRLWTEFEGRRREFYWDGDRLAAEIFPDGLTRVYQYASRQAWVPLGFVDYRTRQSDPSSGASYHVFSNQVGMPLWIEDERGAAVWSAKRLDPYGFVEAAPAQVEYNLRWPGHYFDPETQLQYNRYRYYDPKLARYLQSDPVGYEGSPRNLYAYCPNPLVQVDLLGLDHPEQTSKSRRKSGENDGQEGTPRRTERAANATEISPVTGKKVKGAAKVVEHSVDGEVVARYYVDSKGRTIRAEGMLDPPAKYKKEGVSHIRPDGFKSGRDHRGHLIPERSVAQQKAVNVPENVIAEHGKKSNLSEKKKWENRAREHATQEPGCWSVHEPQYSGDNPRPTSVKHNLYDADGNEVPDFKQDIPNPTR